MSCAVLRLLVERAQLNLLRQLHLVATDVSDHKAQCNSQQADLAGMLQRMQEQQHQMLLEIRHLQTASTVAHGVKLAPAPLACGVCSSTQNRAAEDYHLASSTRPGGSRPRMSKGVPVASAGEAEQMPLGLEQLQAAKAPADPVDAVSHASGEHTNDNLQRKGQAHS
jgi:hypothetical protein